MTITSTKGEWYDECYNCPRQYGVKIENNSIVGDCTPDRDTECVPCVDGVSYNNQEDWYSICHECTMCSNLQVITPCNLTHNIVCGEGEATTEPSITTAPSTVYTTKLTSNTTVTVDEPTNGANFPEWAIAAIVIVAAIAIIAIAFLLYKKWCASCSCDFIRGKVNAGKAPVAVVFNKVPPPHSDRVAIEDVTLQISTTGDTPASSLVCNQQINQQTPDLYNPMVTNDEYRSIPNSRSEVCNQTQDDTEDQHPFLEAIIDKFRVRFEDLLRTVFKDEHSEKTHFIQNELKNDIEEFNGELNQARKYIDSLQKPGSSKKFALTIKSLVECPETLHDVETLLEEIKNQMPEQYDKMVSNDDFVDQMGKMRWDYVKENCQDSAKIQQLVKANTPEYDC